MKFVVVIYPDAESELHEISEDLTKLQYGLGEQLIDEFLETLYYLEEYAEARPLIDRRFRHILINRFQVFIVYVTEADIVSIRKVIHAAREESKRYRK